MQLCFDIFALCITIPKRWCIHKSMAIYICLHACGQDCAKLFRILCCVYTKVWCSWRCTQPLIINTTTNIAVMHPLSLNSASSSTHTSVRVYRVRLKRWFPPIISVGKFDYLTIKVLTKHLRRIVYSIAQREQ